MEGEKTVALKDQDIKNIDTQKVSVLYVDDEKINLRIFKLLMRREFDIHVTESAHDALDLLTKKEIHIIISDQKMDGMNGTELLGKVEEKYPKVVRMLLTGDNSQTEIRDAMKDQNIFACINKPFDQGNLTALFIDAYKKYESS